MMTPQDDPDGVLVQLQLEMEAEAREGGVKRYRKEVLRDQSATAPGRQLLRLAVPLLTTALDSYFEDTLKGVASKNAGVVYYLQQFQSDLLAVVTVAKCVQAMVSGSPVQMVAWKIALELEDHLNHEELRRGDPKIYKRLQRAIAKKGNAHYKHVVLRKYQEHARVVSIKWSAAERIRVGTTLLRLCEMYSGLIEIDQRWHDTSVLKPTPATAKFLLKAHRVHEMMWPEYLPMVVEPKAWAQGVNGGYLGLQLPLVKTRNSKYIAELKYVEMPHVYSALNALQATPWTVNTAVLDVMKDAYDANGGLGGLPRPELLPLPVKPEDIDTNEIARKDWKRRAAEVYDENHKATSGRFSASWQMGMANRLKDLERFYFVYNLDWRGRIYPTTTFLSPQGDDRAKALLRFADGCPLGDGGAFWLAVHGANCYGVDKVSFDDRLQWVLENQNDIVASAMNPLGHHWWANADAPYQFLAFCKEWAGIVLWTSAGKPQEEYISHLPVGLDGSCNGLQNFSMALRDEQGGAATNLIPSDTPSDIYRMVAEKAQEIVDADAEMGKPEAKLWVGKVTRKLSKRPTMTMPYGSGQYGFKDQLLQTLREIKRDTGVDVIEEQDQKFFACVYLAGAMNRAIGSVVVKAREAMDWLQEVAALAAEDGLPVSWTAPSGFPVLQNYVQQDGQRLDFTVAGKRFHLTLRVDRTDLDKRKQRQGIAPNYVHSLDAAHLVRSVNYCMGRGVSNFAVVHDSFGTHAGNVEILAFELRRAFVDQYEPDVIGLFRQQIEQQLTSEKLRKKLPPVPPFGTLDPTAVMQSGYFFA